MDYIGIQLVDFLFYSKPSGSRKTRASSAHGWRWLCI